MINHTNLVIKEKHSPKKFNSQRLHNIYVNASINVEKKLNQRCDENNMSEELLVESKSKVLQTNNIRQKKMHTQRQNKTDYIEMYHSMHTICGKKQFRA